MSVVCSAWRVWFQDYEKFFFFLIIGHEICSQSLSLTPTSTLGPLIDVIREKNARQKRKKEKKIPQKKKKIGKNVDHMIVRTTGTFFQG